MELPSASLRPGIFFGAHQRRAEVAGASLVESRYAPGLRTPRHAHARSGFCIVLDGAFDGTHGRRALAGGRFDIVFRPADELHENRFGPAGARCLNVEIAPRWESLAASVGPLPRATVTLSRTAALPLLARIDRELDANDDLSPLVLEGLVLEMLGETAREARKRVGTSFAPAWLARVTEILHAETAPLSLEAIAALAGVHPVHLARSFRAHHRCSLGEYRRRLRLARARELLTNSHLSLAEIAASCGFAHQSHFSNAFKRAEGLTPGRFRRALSR